MSVKKRTISALLCMVCTLSVIMSGTLTWLATSQAVNSFSGTRGDYSIILEKRERDVAGKETNIPVKNAEFYLFRIVNASPEEVRQVGGRYQTNADGIIQVPELTAGAYYFLETDPPFAYDYDKEEDGVTDKKRYDFSISSGEVDATGAANVIAYNQRIASELEVSKIIENYDGSEVTDEQKEMEFTFKATFNDGKEYPYVIDEGEEQSLDNGTFILKHGETLTFKGVPIGVMYNVTEVTSEEDEHIISSDNHTGNIKPDDNKASFVNIFGYDKIGSLRISKTVTGTDNQADLDAMFTFTVELGKNPDTIYKYNIYDATGEIGSSEIKSGNTIRLKHGQWAVFPSLLPGLEYQVNETEVAGFIQQVIEKKGEIIGGEVRADFINTKETTEDKFGNLIVTKTVEISEGALLPGEDSQGEGSQGEGSQEDNPEGEGSQGGNSQEDNPGGEGSQGEGSQGEGSEGENPEGEGSQGENPEGEGSQSEGSQGEGSQGENPESEEPESENPESEESENETIEDPMEKVFNFTIRVGSDIYTTQLKHGETYRIDNIPVGTDYEVVEEDYYQDGYVTSSINANATIVEGDNHASVKNVLTGVSQEELYGKIRLEKLVVDGDDDKEFTFHVTIGGGEPREIKLKNGGYYESEDLPVGTHYQIYEENYYTDGYITTSVGSMGTVTQAGVLVEYTNTYEDRSTYGQLEVSKKVSGIGDVEKDFIFSVTFSNGEVYPYELTNKAGNTTNQSLEDGKFTLKDGEKATFKDIPAGLTYEVTEEASEGYLQALIKQTGVMVKDTLIQASFENYMPQAETNITIKKLVTGEGANLEKNFEFTLSVGEETYEFTLKNGEEKEFVIPTGAIYEVTEKDYFADGYLLKSIQKGYGTVTREDIEVVADNGYYGPIPIDLKGQKTWSVPAGMQLPEEITVYLKNGEFMVVEAKASADTNWEYEFLQVPKYNNHSGAEVVYTVEEAAISGFIAKVDGLNVTNTYIEAIAVNTPEVEKRIRVIGGEGEAQEATFTFILTGQEDAPMPEGTNGNRKEVQRNGEGKIEFGEISYTLPGTYTYAVEEVIGTASGYTYDTTKYTYTVVVAEDNGVLVATKTIAVEEEVVETIVFTNLYTPSTKDETSLTVHKVWAEIPSDKQQPESIDVQLYKNGKAEGEPVRLSEDNEWMHTWTNLTNDVNWSVDELEIPANFVRVISKNGENGYTITNTYRDDTTPPTATPIPGEEVTPPPTSGGTRSGAPTTFTGSRVVTPKTDDPMARNLWFAILILSVIGLKVVFVASEKENKKRLNKK